MTRAVRVAAGGAVAAALATLGWWGFESGASVDGSRFNAALVSGVYAALVTVALTGAWRRPTDRAPIRLFAAATLLSVSYFRLLEPAWLAAIGALAWLGSPAFVLRTLTEPASRDHPIRLRTWNMAFAVLALGVVAVSGPQASGRPPDARRAISWAWYDPNRQRMVRQPNPLAATSSEIMVIALTAVWWLVLTAVGVLVLRRVARRPWRLLATAGIVATIVLSVPQRLGWRLADDRSLLDGSISQPLIAIPIVCSSAYAAWAVWTELITPRLTRPQALVVQLDQASTIDATRRRLARVVGDPSAAIMFAAGDGWIDDAGRPHDVRPDRRLVAVTQNGATVAALDLDAATPVGPDLLADAAGSLAVSLEARRLAATATAAANDARETAMRLIDIDRDAIEQITNQIEIGPQRTLADVDAMLDQRPLPLDAIHDELRRSLEQVRTIAHRATTPPHTTT